VTRREAARPTARWSIAAIKDDLEILSPDQEFLQQTTYYRTPRTRSTASVPTSS
jgi:hypothetical protein